MLTDRTEQLEKQIDRLLVDIANLRDDAARWRTLHDEVKADLDKTRMAWAEAADERDQRRGERDVLLNLLKEQRERLGDGRNVDGWVAEWLEEIDTAITTVEPS